MSVVPKRIFVAFGITLIFAAIGAGILALLLNIFERKQEAKQRYLKFVEVTEDDVDPAKWGINWPREYDGYLRTSEPTATRYGGALIGSQGALPPQKSERHPWLKRLFAGYLFAVDYRERRGHAFMLSDQEVTKRNVPEERKQSGNCLHCHSSVMPLYRRLGREALPDASPEEQVMAGLERAAKMDYWDAHRLLGEITGKPMPLSCVDCHDPNTMRLRVTRPAFIAGIRSLASSQAQVPQFPSIERWRKGDRQKPYDPNQEATRQEMRTFVCAQCHVEYFCGKGMTIFYPWNQGLKVEEIEAHYKALQTPQGPFRDWVHAETGMDMFKAQHPEFELFSQGIHARAGVACADCHMPYKREGALKVTEHWVRSPLLMVPRACGPCHPVGEQELIERVYAVQDRHAKLLDHAGEAAVEAIEAVKTLRQEQGGADLAQWRERVKQDETLQRIENLMRSAAWRLDFVASENSMGFHAPQESARILGEAIDLFRQAQLLAEKLLAASR